MKFHNSRVEPSSVSSLRLPTHAPTGAWAVDDEDESVVQTREMRTQMAEAHDRLRPATAGLFAGAAAGIFMLGTADRVLRAQPNGYDLVHFVGRLVSGGTLSGAQAHVAGFGAALVAGAAVGVVFALVTRHLRKFGALLFWSLVFFPAAWTLLQAFILPIALPWLATLLPYVPMVAGTAVFAVVVSLQLPLRKGRAPRHD